MCQELGARDEAAKVTSPTPDLQIWEFQKLLWILQNIRTQIEGADTDAVAVMKYYVLAALEKTMRPDPNSRFYKIPLKSGGIMWIP